MAGTRVARAHRGRQSPEPAPCEHHAAGLLVRSAQFVKCAERASLLPRLFAHSLYEADPKLGACLEIAEWRGGNAGSGEGAVRRSRLRHRDRQR